MTPLTPSLHHGTPLSVLTTQRPEIWLEAVGLASSLTGVAFLHKEPLADGTIYACGGGGGWMPQEQREETERERKQEEEERKRYWDKYIPPLPPDDWRDAATGGAPVRIMVPEGAMEWLLHEVGHWAVASEEERKRPNWSLGLGNGGHADDREWQSVAFSEIVLAPFGPSRLFSAPSYRGGVAYSRAAIPPEALRHAERQIAAENIDVALLRRIYGAWVDWGMKRPVGRRPWDSDN